MKSWPYIVALILAEALVLVGLFVLSNALNPEQASRSVFIAITILVVLAITGFIGLIFAALVAIRHELTGKRLRRILVTSCILAIILVMVRIQTLP